MNVIQKVPNIWEIEQFFTEEECSKWIAFSENIGYEEATVSFSAGAKMAKGIRNNERVVHTDLKLASTLWGKLKPFCPETMENGEYKAVGVNERFRFYKYHPGQRFKRHRDGCFERNEHEKSFITFLIYLNEDFTGGHTTFTDINVIPSTGNALCFLHPEHHEGKLVEEGIKYVLRSDVMYHKG